MVETLKTVYGDLQYEPYACEVCWNRYADQQEAENCEKRHENKLTPYEWRYMRRTLVWAWRDGLQKGSMTCWHTWVSLSPKTIEKQIGAPIKTAFTVEHPFEDVIEKFNLTDVVGGSFVNLERCIECGKERLVGIASGY